MSATDKNSSKPRMSPGQVDIIDSSPRQCNPRSYNSVISLGSLVNVRDTLMTDISGGVITGVVDSVKIMRGSDPVYTIEYWRDGVAKTYQTVASNLEAADPGCRTTLNWRREDSAPLGFVAPTPQQAPKPQPATPTPAPSSNKLTFVIDNCRICTGPSPNTATLQEVVKEFNSYCYTGNMRGRESSYNLLWSIIYGDRTLHEFMVVDIKNVSPSKRDEIISSIVNAPPCVIDDLWHYCRGCGIRRAMRM